MEFFGVISDSLLGARIAICQSAALVSGFLTPDGADSLKLYDPVVAAKVNRLIIGAGTYKAFEAIDKMTSHGKTNVRINLGYCMLSGSRKHPYKRFRPMLHSKIYYFENDDGTASAFVGSHNMTGFALKGLNGEAGVLIEGDANDQSLADIRQHIDEAWRKSVPYLTSMKGSYAWWTREYFEGLSAEANDAPRDAESRLSIILVVRLIDGKLPKPGEVVYFELEKALSKLTSVNTEVHLHLFKVLPPTPDEALAQLDNANASFSCMIEGIDMTAGNTEVRTDWHIEDRRQPVLKSTAGLFRPKTAQNMQQVRARVMSNLADRYDYLFDGGSNKWTPEFDAEDGVQDVTGRGIWHRVERLVETDRADNEVSQLQRALRETSPESGSYVLFSRRRRKRNQAG